MMAELRRQADTAAQEALHNMVEYRLRHGRRHPVLEARYEAAERLLDMIDEHLRLAEAAAHDAAYFDPSDGASIDPLPDVPLAITEIEWRVLDGNR